MSENKETAPPRQYRLVKHTTIAPDGSIHRRTSIHRNYTHAVMVDDTKDGWVVASWHEAEDKAQDAADKLTGGKQPRVDKAIVTGVVRMDNPELFAPDGVAEAS